MALRELRCRLVEHARFSVSGFEATASQRIPRPSSVFPCHFLTHKRTKHQQDQQKVEHRKESLHILLVVLFHILIKRYSVDLNFQTLDI